MSFGHEFIQSLDDLAIQSAKLEFWQGFQPKPGAGDLAIESSKHEFWS